MMGWLADIHRGNMELWLSDVCQIEQPTVAGGWTVTAVAQSCEVQAGGDAASSHDPDIAGSEEATSIVVYMAHDAPVSPGARLLWDGDYWEVHSAQGEERSRKWGLRVLASLPQTALRPETVEFRRMAGGTWTNLGLFPVRFTESMPVGQGNTAGATAEARSMVGTMMGGPATVVLEAGDWFVRGQFPGRIMRKDATNPARVEFTYFIEVEAV